MNKMEYLIMVWSIVGVVLLFLILLSVFLSIYCVKKSKKHKTSTQEQLNKATQIITFLGTKENITSIENRQERLEIEIKDVNLLDVSGLNSLHFGASLTKNIIKFSIKKDDSTIINEMKKIIKGE